MEALNDETRLRRSHTAKAARSRPVSPPNSTTVGSQVRSLPGPSDIQAMLQSRMVACTQTCKVCGTGEVVLGRCWVRKSALHDGCRSTLARTSDPQLVDSAHGMVQAQ